MNVVAPPLFLLMWSSGAIFVKLGLMSSSVWTFLAIRSTGATLVLVVVLAIGFRSEFRAAFTLPRRTVLKVVLVGLLLQAGYQGAYFLSIAHRLSLGTLTIILGTQPLLTPWVAREGRRIVVLEKDPTYRHAASALSTSGIRQQFSSAVNVKLSQYTVTFMSEIERHLGMPGESAGVTFHQQGYLYLGGPEAQGAFEANNRLQRSLGVDARLLDRTELAHAFPWVVLDDVAVGSFVGRSEGWPDGYSLMQAFRRRARRSGVE